MSYQEFPTADIIDLRDWTKRVVAAFDDLLTLAEEDGSPTLYTQLSSFDEYLPKLERQLTTATLMCRRLGVKHVTSRRNRPIEPTRRKRRCM